VQSLCPKNFANRPPGKIIGVSFRGGNVISELWGCVPEAVICLGWVNRTETSHGRKKYMKFLFPFL
jgi:hypothetical protein